MSALRDLVGVELEPSRWIEVSQERIDAFAAVTEDAQWIHVDRERAAAGPFGTTIAHGHLTLSLCAPLVSSVLRGSLGSSMTINYGLDRVRFPAPVPAGSRLRARAVVRSVDDVDGGEQAVIRATIEREGSDKPVCVAEIVLRMMR